MPRSGSRSSSAQVRSASPDAVIYAYACDAMADYEASRDVNRFSSKYDASRFAVPPQKGYTLSASELNGKNLYFGKAQCFQCHSSATLGIVQAFTDNKEVFSMYCYANIGVPKNPSNPIYNQTDCSKPTPSGANPDAASTSLTSAWAGKPETRR